MTISYTFSASGQCSYYEYQSLESQVYLSFDLKDNHLSSWDVDTSIYLDIAYRATKVTFLEGTFGLRFLKDVLGFPYLFRNAQMFSFTYTNFLLPNDDGSCLIPGPFIYNMHDCKGCYSDYWDLFEGQGWIPR